MPSGKLTPSSSHPWVFLEIPKNVFKWNWRARTTSGGLVWNIFWNLGYLDWRKCNSQSDLRSFINLVLKHLGSLFGCPYQFNGTKIFPDTILWNCLQILLLIWSKSIKFYSPENNQKTIGFQVLSEGTEINSPKFAEY